DDSLVEIVEITEHRWFVAVQYHPEFKSKPTQAHPLFAGFIGAAVDHNAHKKSDRTSEHKPHARTTASGTSEQSQTPST
ncbi:MAG: hypothetical protein AAGD11_09515, partial [Planctomycetota bacterium]